MTLSNSNLKGGRFKFELDRDSNYRKSQKAASSFLVLVFLFIKVLTKFGKNLWLWTASYYIILDNLHQIGSKLWNQAVVFKTGDGIHYVLKDWFRNQPISWLIFIIEFLLIFCIKMSRNFCNDVHFRWCASDRDLKINI